MSRREEVTCYGILVGAVTDEDNESKIAVNMAGLDQGLVLDVVDAQLLLGMLTLAIKAANANNNKKNR